MSFRKLNLPGMVSRRSALRDFALGFGHTAALALLARSPVTTTTFGQELSRSLLSLKTSKFKPRAKRVIFLFMHGGPSHVDTFDYKPKLIEHSGKPLPFAKPRIQFAKTGNLYKSPWAFKQFGQSGGWVSDLFPNVAQHVDDLCIVKTINGTNEAHGGALLKLHTGSDTFVRPSMGAWISYGLGTENQDLPSFVTLNPTMGHGGVGNWSSAFLPAVHQGTPISARGNAGETPKIAFLTPDGNRPNVQRAQLDLLKELDSHRPDSDPSEDALEARLESFELAYRMQRTAPEAFDLQGETLATKKLYGLDDPRTASYGRLCLLARRMSERGVRFVQATHGYWDQHESLTKDHGRLAYEVDQPIAALLSDLKGRGMLDDTLVLWGGEFGRTPTLQGSDGRDHHPHAFTMWMAGGGIKPGFSYGITDEYGFYCVDQKVHVHDLHATLLALLGLDHESLTFHHAGRDFRLTDVHGDVINALFKS